MLAFLGETNSLRVFMRLQLNWKTQERSFYEIDMSGPYEDILLHCEC